MLTLALQPDDFLLGAAFPVAFGGHRVQFLQTFDGFLYRGHVGEQSAQPALIHVILLAARGFFGDSFLRLALGAHEQHALALRGHLTDVAHGVLNSFSVFWRSMI